MNLQFYLNYDLFLTILRYENSKSTCGNLPQKVKLFL